MDHLLRVVEGMAGDNNLWGKWSLLFNTISKKKKKHQEIDITDLVKLKKN